MLSDGKTGGEELNVGQQWIQMGVRLLRRPDLDCGSAEWLAGCVCDGSLCVCVGSACQIFEYTQSRHIKMVYWWNICVTFKILECWYGIHNPFIRSFGVTSVHPFVFFWFFCGTSSVELEVCSWQLFFWCLDRIIDSQSRQMAVLLTLHDFLPRHQESRGCGGVTGSHITRSHRDATWERHGPSCLCADSQWEKGEWEDGSVKIISALKTWNCLLVLSMTVTNTCKHVLL